MAIKKVRLGKALGDGTYDTIYFETSADMVVRTNEDGTTAKLEDSLKALEDSVNEITGGGGSNTPDPGPDEPDPSDPYAPGESIDNVPVNGTGTTGYFTKSYYLVFEAQDFNSDTNELRVAATYHKMNPNQTMVLGKVRHRLGRTVMDFYPDTPITTIRDKLVACQRAALARFSAGETTDFPQDADGNIMLDWNQVQIWLLEEVLKTPAEAAAYVTTKKIDWKDTKTFDVTTTKTIEDVMSACYIPASTTGGSTAAIDALLALDLVRALHLRQRVSGVPIQEEYNLFGRMTSNTWSDREAEIYWDLKTRELVIHADAPFPGDVLIIN